MIDLETDKLVTLPQAADFLPRLGGKKIHTTSIWRWCRKGVRGVKLENAIIGSRIITSVQALNRFVNVLSEAPLPERHWMHKPGVRRRTDKERTRAMAEAEKLLREQGF